MNRKGGVISWGLYLVLIIIVFTGIAVQSGNTSPENIKEHLVWKELEPDTIPTTELGQSVQISIYKLVNAMGYIAFEFARFGAEFAAENPETPWNLLLLGIILAILAPIILVAIKLGALIFILTREAILTSREKRQRRKKTWQQ